MTISINVPPQTFTAGTHTVGPTTQNQLVGLNHIKFVLDVGSYPPTETITIAVERSLNKGITWQLISSGTRPGGPQDNDGTPDSNAYIETNIDGDISSPDRRVRGAVTLSAPLTTTGGLLTVT